MRRALAALSAAAAIAAGGSAPAPARPVNLEALLAQTPAPTLSAYRLFEADGRPRAGLIPFAPASPLFSDYAEKTRQLYLPPGGKVRYTAEGPLEFPVGATLIKTFAYPADLRRPEAQVRRLETRLMIRQASGWTALAYVWNPEQTEAVLKRAGARIPIAFVDPQGRPRTVDYAVPNTNQCKECHQVDKVMVPIGPTARNLNAHFRYADGSDNQLARWTRMGVLEGTPAAAPRTPAWDDPAEPLERRARAYLDANCAHCHSPRGIASNSGLYLGLEETRPSALGVGKRPVAAGRGSGGLEVSIAPGSPDDSILAYRMASTEPGVMMPELSRSLVHEEGLALVRAWIAQMR